MGWMVISLLVGGGLGALSAYHTRMFLGALISTLWVGFLVMRPIIVLGASASAGSGRDHAFSLYIEGFMMLPASIRGAIILLPVFIIMGRAITWTFRFLSEPPREERDRQYRAEVMSEFGNDHTWDSIINPPEVDTGPQFQKLSPPPKEALFKK